MSEEPLSKLQETYLEIATYIFSVKPACYKHVCMVHARDQKPKESVDQSENDVKSVLRRLPSDYQNNLYSHNRSRDELQLRLNNTCTSKPLSSSGL